MNVVGAETEETVWRKSSKECENPVGLRRELRDNFNTYKETLLCAVPQDMAATPALADRNVIPRG